MSTSTVADPAPTDTAPPAPVQFTITDWYFVWSTESWFLGLILYINTATVFGSLWLNWTARMQLGQCWTLATISAAAFANIIITSFRTTILSDYPRFQALGIAQSVLEWAMILGVLYLNFTRVVNQFHTPQGMGIAWSPSITRALKAGVVTSGIFATVAYVMYIAAYARGESSFSMADIVYAWSGIFDALVHSLLSLSLAYFFQRTIESSPSLQPTGGKMSRAQTKATRLIRSTQMFLVLENLPIVIFNIVRLGAPEFDPQWSLIYFFETLRLRFFLASFVTLFEFDKLINWQGGTGAGNSTGGASSSQDHSATKSHTPESTLTIPVPPQKSAVVS
ncbi:hypothetical protein BCR44DRAFT_45929, partial [Catenaria anguillulae PL171]